VLSGLITGRWRQVKRCFCGVRPSAWCPRPGLSPGPPASCDAPVRLLSPKCSQWRGDIDAGQSNARARGLTGASCSRSAPARSCAASAPPPGPFWRAGRARAGVQTARAGNCGWEAQGSRPLGPKTQWPGDLVIPDRSADREPKGPGPGLSHGCPIQGARLNGRGAAAADCHARDASFGSRPEGPSTHSWVRAPADMLDRRIKSGDDDFP
jgi:hypothetical protein